MGKRVCIVLNCRNGLECTKKLNKELGVKNKSLFKAPKDKNLLDRWIANLGQLKKPLTEHCFVCEEHFSIEDVFRSNDILLSDGTVHRTERIVPKLKPNAIPTVTENYSERKSNAEHEPFAANTANLTGDDCDIKIEIPSLFDNVIPQRNDKCRQNIESSTTENTNHIPEKFNFEMLLSTYSNISLPSRSWGAIESENGQSVTFLTVDKNEVLRRLKIYNDLSVQVLLDDIPIRVKCVPSSVEFCREKDIVDILHFIDNIKVCNNFKEMKRLLKK